MTHSKLPFNYNRCNSAIIRAMLITLVITPLGCNKDEQETSKSPPSQSTQALQPTTEIAEPKPAQQLPVAAAKPLTDLESLLAPIALYPDPLLAELLVASTYPLEVVQAARWLETKPDLATLASKDWDASIMRLASVPPVIKMMNDHLDWTTQLGDTFLSKPSEVMDVIQKLRKRAKDSGFLKDTPELKVSEQTVSSDQTGEGVTAKVIPAVLKKDVITISPAKSDMLYVPQYSSEVAYKAPLAPPPTSGYPGTTVVNVNQTAAPVPSYYPSYYQAPATTTTTSSNDSWNNFATGALVGGLLTWGIMEWADDDDWDDYHYVGHYYGNTVCHSGNCWHGGGGGYYGDRGNINYNKNVNISGNDINIDRSGVFNQSNLKPTQRPANWQPDQRHRRGQAYPETVQQRLGQTQQPGLAGQRLGAAQTLPASTRGFAENRQQSAASALPAERRPSSADIRQQLAQKPGTQDRLGGATQPKPSTREVQGRLGQDARSNALQGINNSGQATRFESQRGSTSRKSASSPGTRDIQARNPIGAELIQRPQIQQPRASAPQFEQRQAGFSNQAGRNQTFGGLDRSQQQRDTQRRYEGARPSAFDGTRNANTTQMSSQRGAYSQQRSANAGNFRSSGGGGMRSGGGGGGRRR